MASATAEISQSKNENVMANGTDDGAAVVAGGEHVASLKKASKPCDGMAEATDCKMTQHNGVELKKVPVKNDTERSDEKSVAPKTMETPEENKDTNKESTEETSKYESTKDSDKGANTAEDKSEHVAETTQITKSDTVVDNNDEESATCTKQATAVTETAKAGNIEVEKQNKEDAKTAKDSEAVKDVEVDESKTMPEQKQVKKPNDELKETDGTEDVCDDSKMDGNDTEKERTAVTDEEGPASVPKKRHSDRSDVAAVDDKATAADGDTKKEKDGADKEAAGVVECEEPKKKVVKVADNEDTTEGA